MTIISKPTSKFELLREKSILAILDGDTDFGTLIINGTDSGIKISMPYLSGPTLCDISNKYTVFFRTYQEVQDYCIARGLKPISRRG